MWKAYVRNVTIFYVRNIGKFYRQAAGGRRASTRITTTSQRELSCPVVHTAELNSSAQPADVLVERKYWMRQGRGSRVYPPLTILTSVV